VKGKNIRFWVVAVGICLGLTVVAWLWQAESFAATSEEVVGEAFGKPVTRREFEDHLKTAAIFSRSGQTNRTPEQIRQEAWQNLAFLHEAHRLGVVVDPHDLQQQLKRLMAEKGIEYPSPLYENWVRWTFQEEPKRFEKRLEDLMRINQLLEEKFNRPVTVTEEEIREKFFNQYNNIESEYICFKNGEQADQFLKEVQSDPKRWKEMFDQKKAEAGQRGAAWINIMSLEALMDLWKIPKEDLHRLLEAHEGDFVRAKNYYGDCVFRLLHKHTADLKELDDAKREYYRKALTSIKQRKDQEAFLKDLMDRANIRDYEDEKRKEEERKQQEAKIEALKKKAHIRLETNRGPIELKLFPDVAPKACENFIGLVEKGYYDGITFHRVIKGFMIQGGDPTGEGSGGESIWGKPFEDEVRDDVVFDRPGLLAMANAGPNTNTSQFFITTVPTPWLNGKHTIFGEVVSGMDVVHAIESVPTDERDKPKENQTIVKAVVIPSP
jgi:peptidylprolyl isomerase